MVPTQRTEPNPLSKRNRKATIRPSYTKADDADHNPQFTCPLTALRITRSGYARSQEVVIKMCFDVMLLRFPAATND